MKDLADVVDVVDHADLALPIALPIALGSETGLVGLSKPTLNVNTLRESSHKPPSTVYTGIPSLKCVIALK